MLNARTWHRLCVSSYLAFPAVVVAGVLPKDSLIIWLPIAVIAWAFLVGIFGAIQGVILAFGRLYAGCPVCNAKSSVTGGDRDGMYLDCPRCGRLRLKLGRLRGLQAIRPGSKEDGLTGYRSGAVVVSPLVAPIRYFIPFTIIFIPVVASIVAASIIKRSVNHWFDQWTC